MSDAAKLPLMLSELRLPTIGRLCALPRLECFWKLNHCLI
jgi:hypothetical protein